MPPDPSSLDTVPSAPVPSAPVPSAPVPSESTPPVHPPAEAPELLVWTPEMIARFWAFEKRATEVYFAHQVGAALVQHCRHELSGAGRILDYGAGTGFLIEDLLAAGHACAAVEHGEDVIRELDAKLAGHPRFLGARSGPQMLARGELFDLVFLTEVVEHLYDPALVACLDEIAGLLRPGGLLILTTPNEEDLAKSLLMSPESGKLYHRWQHVRSWSAASLSEAVAARGLEVVRTEATDLSLSPRAFLRTKSLPERLARIAAKRLRNALRPRKPPHLLLVARKP